MLLVNLYWNSLLCVSLFRLLVYVTLEVYWILVPAKLAFLKLLDFCRISCNCGYYKTVNWRNNVIIYFSYTTSFWKLSVAFLLRYEKKGKVSGVGRGESSSKCVSGSQPEVLLFHWCCLNVWMYELFLI